MIQKCSLLRNRWKPPSGALGFNVCLPCRQFKQESQGRMVVRRHSRLPPVGGGLPPLAMMGWPRFIWVFQ